MQAVRGWRRLEESPPPPPVILSLSAELDGDRLQLGVVLQGGLAVLTALAGHLEATEGRAGVNDVVAVDPHGPRLHLPGVAVRLVDVLGPDGGRQTVGGVV